MQKRPYQLYRVNDDFLSGRYESALAGYAEGTRQEDAFAAVNLAYMYREGIGVARNYETAVSLYRSALYLDEGVAAFNLALHYMRGLGVPIDLKTALSYMEKSAAQGCIDAQLYLGLAYLLGCVYDPAHIECIHYIPRYRVVPRSASALLEGGMADPALEDQRWEVISPDPERSAEMYRDGVQSHDADEFSEQVGDARFMLGQAMIEGVGGAPKARAGYRQIAAAALMNGHRDSARFLCENAELAEHYGVNMERVRGLLGYSGSSPRAERMLPTPPRRPKK